ncbi:MAG TPA: xanthine dehydrogenase family protein molybdopterin-binding subunit, partial [Chloroflexota bacterium]|nr:xanthine dehydrogenase family protein molybdopterin-binding subunit [Chloroflexota bacterium]
MIGASPPRPDALGKVTGAARYPGDLVSSGMLRLAVASAGRPHARIRSIDAAPAMAMPGVVAVLTAADVPRNAYGLIEADQPVLCGDVVRFVGDRVALVVAETNEAAEAGARLVRVTYEDLPPVLDAAAALAPDAPVVHPARGTNLLEHARIRKGDAAAALRAADVVVDGEFETGWQEHAFLQPEAGVAYVDDAGRVVVETAGQWLHEDRRQIAEILGLSEEQVVVRYAAIGGAFGGREDLSVQHLLALAAWKLRRPVALTWSREESILGHHKRHPMRIRCRWGARRDGRVVAVEADLLADGGAYASTSAEVIKAATLLSTGPYEVPNVALDGRVVYTNNIPCGAFRGFGSPQAQFAAEVMVTRLAHALGMDPVELRRRNLYQEGSIEPTQRAAPPGVGARRVLERCVEEARARLEYGTRPHSAPGHALHPGEERFRRGVAICCGIKNVGYSFGFPEQATATVELYGRAGADGGEGSAQAVGGPATRGEATAWPARAVLRIGAADVGQGAHLALRQIAAHELGLPLDAIALVAEDSSGAPNAGSASASRMTTVGGRAVKEAAAAALAAWKKGERPARATYQHRPTPTTPLDPETTAGRPNFSYGYAAQAVEVEVDTWTGQVRVLRVVSVHDVGRVINPQMLEGQVEGCVAQGIGYALLENFQVRDGRVLTPSFSTYLLPTSLDVPTEIVPIFLETPDPNGPYGARGVAEMPFVPIAPAIAAAIHDATGAWV